MKNCYFLFGLFFLTTISFAQQTTKSISGRVTDGFSSPLAKANVVVKETKEGTFTNAQGRYSISVEVGQTLVFTFVGKRTAEVLIEDVTEILNIELYEAVNELSGVEIAKSRVKSQEQLLAEYSSNKRLIRTGIGIIDTERYGFRTQVFNQDELNVSATSFDQMVIGRIPGITFRQNSKTGTLQAFLPRSNGSPFVRGPAAFEIDGVLILEVPTFLDPAIIERIAIIQSAGALARYGTIAAGGLIIINTKTASYAYNPDLVTDQARLRNNYYKTGDAKTWSESMPSYMETLKSTSRSDAFETYTTLAKSYGASPYFHLDAYEYLAGARYTDAATKVKNKIWEKYNNNALVMKSLAYLAEVYKDSKTSLDVYEQVLKLRPNYQQSYFDLARAYERNGNQESAARIYARYYNLINDEKFEVSETFAPIMARDFTRFLDQIKGKDFAQTVSVSNEEKEFRGTRMLFEWNNSDAEFELQFVNPEKQFYKFAHTMLDNDTLMGDEKRNGYSSREYLIYEGEGLWQVNAKYKGNKSLTPTFLKVTIQHNYGLPSQRDEVRVFRLYVKDVNQKLFTLAHQASSLN